VSLAVHQVLAQVACLEATSKVVLAVPSASKSLEEEQRQEEDLEAVPHSVQVLRKQGQTQTSKVVVYLEVMRTRPHLRSALGTEQIQEAAVCSVQQGTLQLHPPLDRAHKEEEL